MLGVIFMGSYSLNCFLFKLTEVLQDRPQCDRWKQFIPVTSYLINQPYQCIYPVYEICYQTSGWMILL